MYRRLVVIIALLLIMNTMLASTSNEGSWWGSVISWYQYPDVEQIAGSQPTYVIVDPDYGPNDEPWTRDDLDRLKSVGVKVIAYLNIGFAEEWRNYWNETWSEDEHPEWLYWVEYPDWPGEYFVAYRHSSAWESGGWVDILKNELDKIVSMGFDGVRMDNIDSCDMWENPDEYGLAGDIPEVDNATEWMIYLVGNLSSYVKSIKPGFIVVANMGGRLDLLENNSFLASIDVVEREEVWYSDNTPVDPVETSEALYWLRYARDHGKDVVVTDYAWSREYVEDALSKARDEGFYIYVAPNYDLDCLPLYIPVYDGIDVAGSPQPVVAWSYQGVYGGDWVNSSIYIAHFTPEGLTDTTLLSGTDSIDRHVSCSCEPGSDRVLVVWETNEDTVDYTWIKGVLVDPSDLSIVAEVTIARDDGVPIYYPSITTFNNYYYVVYVKDTSLYYALVSMSGAVVDRVYIGEVGGNKWTSVDSGSSGVLILWLSKDGVLKATLVSGSDILWTRDVSDQAEPYRFGVVYVDGKGYLIVYQRGDSAISILLNGNGDIIASLSNIPDITWCPRLLCFSEDIVAYTGIGKLYYLWIKSIEYIGSVDIEFRSTTGTGLLEYNGLLYALGPGVNENNTLVLETIANPPQPIPESSSVVLSILIMAFIAVFLIWKNKV